MSRASHCVTTAVPSYFAVYPDGRRVSVDLAQAERNWLAWRREGVRILTVITSGQAPVFDDCEYE